MIPIVYINCSSAPFVDYIMTRSKVFETRSRNTLKTLTGKRILIAETGNGHKSIVRCSARIRSAFPITSQYEWDLFRDYTKVYPGSPFDWSDKTRCKWLYELEDIQPVPPFHPVDGIRHGRVWMEYNGREQ